MARANLIRALWVAFAIFNLAMLIMQYLSYSSGVGISGSAVFASTIGMLFWLGVWGVGLLLFGFVALIVWDHGKRPMK